MTTLEKNGCCELITKGQNLHDVNCHSLNTKTGCEKCGAGDIHPMHDDVVTKTGDWENCKE